MDRAFRYVLRRNLCLAHFRSSPKPASASEIRKAFLDFFCEDHKHMYIRSSPVFSLRDPTLAFTNAGMNQFKDVFLGLEEPPSSRVANYQKCVRIGGLHNDLEDVGRDGSHHTFFEMLGNWSFGDYFKEEGCRMSWNLLTQVYDIPPERLYVTYFGGDAALGLNPDVEVQEIWRQIGVKESHILPFGAKDNFWLGNVTGPCGPCTEIHYDHVPGRTEAGNLVNSGTGEVTELWNLVFTEFDKKKSGELTKLRKHFVDTGMGLERLVTVLQGKTSSYDTDLFLPLFEVIREHTGHSGYTGMYDGNSIDCSYRVLADHSRMIAVTLSDGILPYHQAKVRGIIVKTLNIIQKTFRAKPDLLKELSSNVAEILSDAYPNIGKNLSRIHCIIDHEVEKMRSKSELVLAEWQKLKKAYPALNGINISEFPQILDGLKYLSKNILNQAKTELSAEDIFTLYDTYGIPPHMMEQMALKLGLGFDMTSYLDYQNSNKTKLRELQHNKYVDNRKETAYIDILPKLEDKKIQPTFDYFKYDYRVDGEGKYVFPKQETTIEAILYGNELLDEISAEEMKEDQEIGLILDRTQLFSEEGGQASDCGVLEIEKEIAFDIKNVVKIKNFVIHFGVFRKIPSNSKVSVKNIGVLHLDENRRIDIMRNHTALHLVNAFLSEELEMTQEKFSSVKPEKLLLKCRVYIKNLNSTADILKLENYVKDFIVHGVSVNRKIFSLPQFQALDDVKFIPGESILSREIPVIEISRGFKLSRELCRGTHVLNTSDLKDFIVTKYVQGSYRTPVLEAVTGEKCAQIRKSDSEMRGKWSLLKKNVYESPQLHPSKFPDLDQNLKQFLLEVSQSEGISQLTRNEITTEVSDAKIKLMSLKKLSIRNFMLSEIHRVCQESNDGFIVHCLKYPRKFSSEDVEAVAIQRIDKPIFILLNHNGSASVLCAVPEAFVSPTFSARQWLIKSAFCLGGFEKCRKLESSKFFACLLNRSIKERQILEIMNNAVKLATRSLWNITVL